MKNVGIICEYDPFHGGHEYLIRRAREAGAERVICLMSGDTVQRGSFAMLPPACRARAALAGGADAVLELPFPWCSASAEYFAGAGISVLSRLGIDTVAFGSETADLPRLTAAAEAAAAAKRGGIACPGEREGSAEGYFSAVGLSGVAPNDILGIEYIKAAILRGAGLEFFPVHREGAGHNAGSDGGKYPSASALRAVLAEGRLPDALPAPMREEAEAALRQGDAPILPDRLSAAFLAYWRLTPPDRAAGFAECGGGAAGRLHAAACAAADLDGMLALAATKKYTASRLRRAALFALTGVTAEDLGHEPAFVRLLAAGEGGRAFLASTRRTRQIPVVTKRARRPGETGEQRRQAELADAVSALASLARPVPRALTDVLRSE